MVLKTTRAVTQTPTHPHTPSDKRSQWIIMSTTEEISNITTFEWFLAQRNTFFLIAIVVAIAARLSTAGKVVEAANEGANTTAGQAVASAAIGSATVVGGTSLAAAGLGYTTGGIAAGSVASTIMATEAAVMGGSVAAGGFTATLQAIGAVGVMARPMGVTLATAGAIGGLGAYFAMNRRS